jgi:hypothetical protein
MKNAKTLSPLWACGNFLLDSSNEMGLDLLHGLFTNIAHADQLGHFHSVDTIPPGNLTVLSRLPLLSYNGYA